MATELQRQVRQLKEQQLASGTASLDRGGANHKPSLFLNEKEAAGVAVSDVWEAAVKGLRALAQYDMRLTEYLDSLLHESRIDMKRELKTEEVTVIISQIAAQ